MNYTKIIEEINAVRDRETASCGTQALYGNQTRNLRPSFYLALLTEKLGKISGTIIDGDSLGYREELIELAAVAFAALDEFDNGSAIGNIEAVCIPIKYQKELDGLAEIEQEPD